MAIAYTDLFTRLGLIFGAQEVLNTARGTTFPPQIQAILDEFDSEPIAIAQAVDGVAGIAATFASGGNAAQAALRDAAGRVLIAMVNDDVPLLSLDTESALVELLSQMADDSQSVDASAVGLTVTPGGDNDGDGVVVASVKRPDGRPCELVYAETVTLRVTSDTIPATAIFLATGEPAVADMLSASWPGGSGISRSITAVTAANSLLGNGDFDDEDDVANAPDEWIVSVGTIGTTIKMTDYEVQEIAITGSPSAGTYIINWTNPASVAQSTAPIAYNATGSDVQAALRLLTGLANITVSTTGTAPNYTHTITFTGVAGNLSEVTVTNNTTGGTFTPGTTTAGSASAYIGRAVEFDSNGSQTTTINRQVALSPLRQYAVNLWMLADVVPAAGVITIDLVDGIGGNVIADESGTNNSFTVDCTALDTSFEARNGVFRTPRDMPSTAYLRIRISTAVSSGTSIFLDHCALTEMTELYPGGPWVAAFSGAAAWRKGDGQVAADEYEIAFTNDRAGKFHDYFQRNFDLLSKRLLIPSNSGGSETIDDALIT